MSLDLSYSSDTSQRAEHFPEVVFEHWDFASRTLLRGKNVGTGGFSGRQEKMVGGDERVWVMALRALMVGRGNLRNRFSQHVTATLCETPSGRGVAWRGVACGMGGVAIPPPHRESCQT